MNVLLRFLTTTVVRDATCWGRFWIEGDKNPSEVTISSRNTVDYLMQILTVVSLQ